MSEAHRGVQLLADKWLAATQSTTRTNSRVQKFRASLKRRCPSDLYIKKTHERDSQLHRIEDVMKFAESEWAAMGIARPLFRRASIVFGPPFKAPQTPAEHAKDEVISNDFADCDNKDLLGKRFDKTSLETLEDAEDEIIKQWLRSPVESIGDSTGTIF
ncbi:hypothetical protein CEP51_007409 [Fusarium floridanum]|uniref:Uncharacterized protein n=1 Tax=Fusarium floridanum TaxID=1325733 RepID=A0A428RPD2_9HYPO|nr:hypothetical protein CEP51_007409 [Fusarium floridanum]